MQSEEIGKPLQIELGAVAHASVTQPELSTVITIHILAGAARLITAL